MKDNRSQDNLEIIVQDCLTDLNNHHIFSLKQSIANDGCEMDI